MFKSIISKIKTFGQTVVNRIVGFIGGIIGIKPEAIQIPAPPEVTNEVSDTAESKTEEKEGFVKKTLKQAFQIAKKVAIATIKAVYAVTVVAAFVAFNYACYTLISRSGMIALIVSMWQAGGVAELGVILLANIGACAVQILSFELLTWALSLVSSKKKTPVAIPVEVVVEVDLATTKPTAITTPEVVITAPAVVATPTPVTTTETEVVLTAVDSSPAVNTTPTKEVTPVVIEIEDEDEVEETVDSSPVPPTNINHPLSMLFVLDEATLTKELTELNMEAIKKMIVALNSHLKAPQKVSSHPPKNTPKGEGKNVLINRIKRQVKDIRANNQMVAA
jgi:hypothetical protein